MLRYLNCVIKVYNKFKHKIATKTIETYDFLSRKIR